MTKIISNLYTGVMIGMLKKEKLLSQRNNVKSRIQYTSVLFVTSTSGGVLVNVGYRWICVTCKNGNRNMFYEGETVRSARIQGVEHVKDCERQKRTKVFF